MRGASVLKKIPRPFSIFGVDTFAFLVDLYARGGALVCSSRTNSAKDAGCGNPAIYARTLVQPDGDIITQISDYIGREEWEAHCARLRAKLSAIHQLRMGIRWISTAGGYLTLVQLLYNLYKQPAFWAWSELTYWYLIVTLVLFLARPILIFIFRAH